MEPRYTLLEQVLLNSSAMLLFTAALALGVIASLVGFKLDIRKSRPPTRGTRLRAWRWRDWCRWG
jgi:hypothetical protein